MFSSFATGFSKTADCPASQALLSFHRSLLTANERHHIEYHLISCDFCCAELRLLAHYRDAPPETSFPVVPLHLRRLAEDLLRISPAPFIGFSEIAEPRQVSH
jgi:hypothetical protein